MITITNCSDFLKSFQVPPLRLEMRHRTPNRALVIDLTQPLKFLENQGEWLNTHAIPFDRNREEQAHYGPGFIAKAGAHIGLVKAGFQARTFCYPCDARPFYHHNQLLSKDGTYLTVNIVRSQFNSHFDKLRMDETPYKEVFWEVLRLCGEKAGPVASKHNLAFAYTAADPPPRRSADIDWQAQAGDNVGQITKPCIMVSEGVLFRDYEPSAYGLDELPRYYDHDTDKLVVVSGETKGQLVKVSRPLCATRGSQVYSHIIAAVFEGHNLILMGAMPIALFIELTQKTRVLLQFDPTKPPASWRIMPLACASWIPMQTFLEGLRGFDQAVESGGLVLSS